MKPRIAIVIVIWNGKEDTLACLDSLRADTYPNKHILIVDNGSTDDSVAAIRTQFPEVEVLQTHQNLGFTGGNNAGIRHAVQQGADYLYLLNNDTIVEPGALSDLVTCAEANPQYGLLCPVIHYLEEPRDPWFCGARLDLRRGLAVHDNSHPPARTDQPYDLPWATGCAVLMRSTLIRDLAGFDDRFFLSVEDVDLSLRVRKAGYQLAAVPSARIYHKVGGQRRNLSPVLHYYAVRNSLLLARLHAGGAYLSAALWIVSSFVRSSLRKDERASVCDCLASVFRGVRDHLIGAYGPYREAAR